MSTNALPIDVGLGSCLHIMLFSKLVGFFLSFEVVVFYAKALSKKKVARLQPEGADMFVGNHPVEDGGFLFLILVYYNIHRFRIA